MRLRNYRIVLSKPGEARNEGFAIGSCVIPAKKIGTADFLLADCTKTGKNAVPFQVHMAQFTENRHPTLLPHLSPGCRQDPMAISAPLGSLPGSPSFFQAEK